MVGDDQPSVWRPPRRRHGLPDAGVVTLEEQSDEEHAFGPAAQLVTEWQPGRPGQGRDAQMEVGDGVAAGLSPDIAAGDGASDPSWKGRPPPLALGRPSRGTRGTGRSEAGAHPATHIHPWPVVEIGSGPATSEQAIRGLGSFHAHGEVGVQAGRFGGDEAGHQRERRH